ncbi:hypothetical protein D3C80_301510 [compost metagenome]
MVGATDPPTASSITNEWPPPIPPGFAPAPVGPAAVASSAVVGSAPAAMACCSSSTDGAACAVAALRSATLSGASALHWVSRPRSRMRPSASSRLTAPPGPVWICSPANTRSPSTSTRWVPSGEMAITWPTILLTMAMLKAALPGNVCDWLPCSAMLRVLSAGYKDGLFLLVLVFWRQLSVFLIQPLYNAAIDPSYSIISNKTNNGLMTFRY